MIPIGWYLILSAILFLIGVLGFFIKRNIIALLLSVEIMLNAVNLTFVAFSSEHGQISGQIFVFFVSVVAAAEEAEGLALVIAMFGNRESLNVDRSNLLKWYMDSFSILWLIPVLPLTGAVVNGVLGKRLPKNVISI